MHHFVAAFIISYMSSSIFFVFFQQFDYAMSRNDNFPFVVVIPHLGFNELLSMLSSVFSITSWNIVIRPALKSFSHILNSKLFCGWHLLIVFSLENCSHFLHNFWLYLVNCAMLCCLDRETCCNPLVNVNDLFKNAATHVSSDPKYYHFSLVVVHISVDFSKTLLCCFGSVPHMHNSGVSLRSADLYE